MLYFTLYFTSVRYYLRTLTDILFFDDCIEQYVQNSFKKVDFYLKKSKVNKYKYIGKKRLD